MKHRTMMVAAIVAAAGMMAWAQPGQDKSKPATPGQPDKAQPGKPADKGQPGKPADKTPPGQLSEQEMMDAYMKAGTPGKEHEVLNDVVGSWTANVKSWHTADSPVEESTGTAVGRWILGNRYLQQEFKGEFAGMPFEGVGVWGYDNVKKQYFSTWMDSMSTGMMLSSGKYDAASKTFTMTGTYPNPITGKDEKAREVIKIVNNNKHTMEFYGNDMVTGKEYKMMEITYTRTGGAEPAGDATTRPAGR